MGKLTVEQLYKEIEEILEKKPQQGGARGMGNLRAFLNRMKGAKRGPPTA